MFLRRIVDHLKTQNWTAIGLDLAIVVIGVFIGTQVSNWNAQRLEKRETQRMLAQLKPNLKVLTDYYANARVYYATTRHYAGTAFAGWRRDPAISDKDFVIAAYQASQIIGIGTNGSTWATVLGADQLRRIDDLAIRNNLSFLMSADYTQLDVPSVNTPYRQNVRRVIPDAIQEAVRKRCGDIPPSAPQQFNFILPATCDLEIAPDEAAEAARMLRASPELARDLQWHMAAQSALLSNMRAFELATEDLQKRISGISE
jgi:hypothetical protein